MGSDFWSRYSCGFNYFYSFITIAIKSRW